MVYVAKNSHLTIVELMLEKGANDYNWAMVRAASNQLSKPSRINDGKRS